MTTERTIRQIEVNDPSLFVRLCGPKGDTLQRLGERFSVTVGSRGSTVWVQGDGEQVTKLETALHELLEVLRTRELTGREIESAAQTMHDHPNVSLTSLVNEVVLTTPTGKIVRPKGVTQQRYVRAMSEHDIVFGVGPAGTGKTYLAMAMAVRALQERRVTRIVLTRPAVEAGERLGFLPGSLAEKINPYLRPLYDALYDMIGPERVESMIERGTIEVAPLAFMRGRTLSGSFVILDEAQNTTPEQMKMFLTRIGFDSKAVVTGDVTQVDLPGGTESGLRQALRVLQGVPGIEQCEFTHSDVVRHPLVQRIILAYAQFDDAKFGSGRKNA